MMKFAVGCSEMREVSQIVELIEIVLNGHV
jgi:hypothetical protein